MDAAYTIFGDESICPEKRHVVYALVIVPTRVLVDVEYALASVKTKWGGQPSSPIHCRTLLAPDQRKRTDWAHLENQQPILFLHDVVLQLGGFGIRTIVGHVDALEWRTLKGIGDIPDLVVTNPKQLVPSAFVGATGVLWSQGEFFERCILYADTLTDSVYWYNRNKKLSSLMKTNYASGSSPLAIDSFLQPSPFPNGVKPVLLEMADVLAYVSMRKLSVADGSKKYSDRYMAKMFDVLAPQICTMRASLIDP